MKEITIRDYPIGTVLIHQPVSDFNKEIKFKKEYLTILPDNWISIQREGEIPSIHKIKIKCFQGWKVYIKPSNV